MKLEARSPGLLSCLVFCLLAASLLTACPAKDPAPAAEAPAAGALAVARGKIDTQKGVLDLHAPLPGEVASVLVSEGDAVKRGQELVRLQATAAELDLGLLEAEIKQAETSRQSQQEALDALTRQSRRLLEAVKLGAIEMQKADDALAAQQQAAAALASTRASIEVLQKRRAILHWQLQRLSIKAPADGRILKLEAQPGSLAGPDKSLLSLLPASPLIVRAEVNESFVGALKIGMQAQILLESQAGSTPLTARLTRIAPVYRAARLDDEAQLRSNVRVLECVLEFAQQPDLRVGQNVRVEFRP